MKDPFRVITLGVQSQEEGQRGDGDATGAGATLVIREMLADHACSFLVASSAVLSVELSYAA